MNLQISPLNWAGHNYKITTTKWKYLVCMYESVYLNNRGKKTRNNEVGEKKKEDWKKVYKVLILFRNLAGPEHLQQNFIKIRVQNYIFQNTPDTLL